MKKPEEGARVKEIKNLGASVRARLLNIAKQTNRDFNAVLLQYFQERSKESSIAEKFQALVKLNILTSRMKDIYDILFLVQTRSFKLDVLREAVKTTFSRRETALEDRSAIFSEAFIADAEKQTQWRAFLNRNRIDSYKGFPEAVARLKEFLEPVCDSQFKLKDATWDNTSCQWK